MKRVRAWRTDDGKEFQREVARIRKDLSKDEVRCEGI